MKKIIASLFSLIAAVSLSSAASVAITIAPNTATNVMGSLFGGYAKITSVAFTCTSSSNAVINVYDSPTALFTYTNAPYTNITSYATNLVTSWTNYFGVVNSATNVNLVDVTNSVAGTTNNYSQRFSVAALVGTTTTINPTSYVFENGIWATNTSAGSGTLTVQFVQ